MAIINNFRKSQRPMTRLMLRCCSLGKLLKPIAILMVAVSYCLMQSQALQAQGENVLLVVNASSPDSLAIANHYVHLRKIPANNVVYLDTVTFFPPTDKENVLSEKFQKEIFNPVHEAIEQRGLAGQIDCIAYSAGFPTRVNFTPEVNKYLKLAGLKYDIQFHAPFASLTSLTYFRENVFSDNPDFVTLDSNWYASPQVKNILSNPFSGATANSFESASDKLKSKDYEEAIQLFSQLVEENPNQIVVRYLLASAYAGNGDSEDAIEQLSTCMQQGWCYRSFVARDPSFLPLKDDAQFKATLESMLDLPADTRLSRKFKSENVWSKNGWPNGAKEQGRQYMLSTMLAVVEPGASTLKQALAQIESSVEADGTKPRGTFYFAKHNDIRSKIRHIQIDKAAAELKSLGFDVEVGDSIVPVNNKRIVGATLGSPVIDWKKSKSKFVAGALCDNFTSYGAWWEKTVQTQLTEYLNAGAAGASGTVYEPYTITPKFPDARLHVHYARGCTLAEAFYQSVDSPFQLLVVGDPLCCPFGEFPKFKVDGLETRTVVKDNIDLTLAAEPGGPEISHFEIFFDGKFLVKANENQKVRIEIDDMSDGYHDIRIAAVSRALTATRASEVLEFFVRQTGHSVKLEVEKQQVRMGEPLVITASSTPEHEVEIRQNSRVVGTVKGNEKLEIDSSLLGQGKLLLQGFIVADDKTIASVPVEIEILP